MMSSESVSRKKVRSRFGWPFHVMIIPGIIFLVIFSYVPMAGIIMAFQDFVPAKGIFGSNFVGFKHFIYMFQLPDIWNIIRNTVVIALGKIILGTLAAIIFSILLNEIRLKTLKKSVQTIVYLPHFLSWVVLAAVVVNMFSLDGTVNQILAYFGVDAVNFLGSNTWFQPLLIGTDVWKEFGYTSIVYLAAITSVDPGLHEAASIDGAGWWKRIWNVTLPGILPIILLMGVMNMANVLNAGFDQVYNLYNPMVYATGDILDTYVYRMGLVGRQYSFGTAVGLFKSVIGIVLLLSANKLAQKYTDRKIF
ncbi:ABC transporter permease [Paenibacillus yanchengensis]|uniref:ABC transporter permease n=1 Tax=Paenibacillus yanchengensis TaxID=2035833 RepID=A0ABW4YJU1_9BACL